MKSASLGRRTGAAILDIFLFYVIHIVALVLLADRLPDGLVPKMLWIAGTYAALLLLYGAPEILRGATLGKRLLGLRVLLGTGDEAPRRLLGLRWLLKSLPILLLFVVSFALAFGAWRVEGRESLSIVAMSTAGGLVLLVALTDFLFALGPKRRALRDRAVGTLVADLRVR